MVDFPDPFGPAITVMTGTLISGRVRLQFANDFVVVAGGSAGNPADFEFPPVRILHQLEAVLGKVEHGPTGIKRFLPRLMSGGSYRFVEFGTAESVLAHFFIIGVR